MSGKDGKNDPQDSNPNLFPITSEERAKLQQRLADNFCRMTELQREIEDATRDPKSQIERLKKANAAIVEELRTSKK